MKPIIVLMIILSVFSCSKTEDDTDNVCTSDCTTVQGRFVTLNNVGVEGVKVSLKYKIPSGPLGGGAIRYIVDTETDENGYFNEAFYVKDSELGDAAAGYFIIDYDDTGLNVDEYILSDNLVGNTTQPLTDAIPRINNRDTIIGRNYYLPKKTRIKVNLNNFAPMQEGDTFEVRTLYPFGPHVGYNEFLESEYATGFSGWGTFVAGSQNTLVMPYVAENENNIIRVFRRKNGVNTSEDISIFVPSNNTIELNYEY